MALVLRCSNFVITSKPLHPHLQPHHPLRPPHLDTAVIRTSTSPHHRCFDTAATPASTEQFSGRHNMAILSRPLPPLHHDRHHATAAATSTAPTRPCPNTTPSPPATALTAPSPSGTHISDINRHPNPPRQACNGATYAGAVSTRCYCHVGITQDSTTPPLPQHGPPPLWSATTPPTPPASMPPHWCHLDSAATATTSDCHFNMAATRFKLNPIDTATTTSTLLLPRRGRCHHPDHYDPVPLPLLSTAAPGSHSVGTMDYYAVYGSTMVVGLRPRIADATTAVVVVVVQAYTSWLWSWLIAGPSHVHLQQYHHQQQQDSSDDNDNDTLDDTTATME
ncbi:hypothetical protein EDB89DRAFT_1914766 [Lactarius sanguifluus]|nr:hypothetical protein EDB89DRAFT_1914766 [Lactarius sanguifluus]